jgi:hypothetical protein
MLGEATALAERVGDPTELAACALTGAEVELSWGNAEPARCLIAVARARYEELGTPAGSAGATTTSDGLGLIRFGGQLGCVVDAA